VLDQDQMEMKEIVSSVREVFDHCFDKIGGKANEDIRWYYRRPKTITRAAFFESALWAIWVSGMSRKAASTFLKRAEQNGLPSNHKELGSWDGRRLRSFMEGLHGRPVAERSVAKWRAVRQLANEVSAYESDSAFRTAFFQGKRASGTLDGNDVDSLLNRNLPFIKKANAFFIVRNMGGEAIKPDRWLQAFLAHYSLTMGELLKVLSHLSIPAGLFDLVVWCYCEEHVRDVKNFEDHFERFSTKRR